MDDDHKYAIPAASIGDIDLDAVAQNNPTAAKEIARLKDLMGRGEETPEEFCILCELLYDVGETANSEYLLRRNLDEDDPSHDLYFKLFGNDKPDEFDNAIESFKSQFNVSLTFVEKNDFLDTTFNSSDGPPRSDIFELLSNPCEIRFGFTRQDKIECDITKLNSRRDAHRIGESLFMFFVNGVWEIADPTDA